jgi:hypothetical protein
MLLAEIPAKIIKPLDGITEVRQDLPVTLKVQTDKPAAARWFKNGQPVESDDNVEVSVNGNFQKLMIKRASAEDAGEYVCKVGDEETKGVISIKGRSEDWLTRSLG